MNLRRLRSRLHRPAAPDPIQPPAAAAAADPAAPGPDEMRLRHHLRRALDGPTAPPEHTVTVTVPLADRDPYWLDQLLTARRRPAAPAAAAAPLPEAPAAPEQPPPDANDVPDVTKEPGEPGERAPWWHLPPRPPLTAPAPPAPQPGIHITVVQHTEPTGPTLRARVQWWTIRRGTAALVGYFLLGLGPVIGRRLEEAGPGALGFAVLLWLVAWFVAAKASLLVPRQATREVHIAADWALHIPSATVLLALALHTPGATL